MLTLQQIISKKNLTKKLQIVFTCYILFNFFSFSSVLDATIYFVKQSSNEILGSLFPFSFFETLLLLFRKLLTLNLF